MTDAPKTNLRGIVLDVLLLSEEKGFTDRVISETLDNHNYLSKQDRSFIKYLSEGTIERKILLDHIIDHYSKIKVRKLKKLILEVLRMSVFQLYFMDSVPDSAVVNEAVKLVKRRHMAGLSGYVNGVLRSVVKEPYDISLITDLHIKYSCPEWITDIFTERFGKDTTETMLKHFTGARTLYARTNTDKIKREELIKLLDEEGIESKEADTSEAALILNGVDSINRIKAFREGMFSVQDISSIRSVEALDIRPGTDVLDVCSAPGGKACYAAEILKGSGSVTACDISEFKTSLIEENTERLGLNNITVQVKDATECEPEFKEKFDYVIADLPCSGLGVIGRKNDIKYRVRPEDITALATLQKTILNNAVTYLKAGGKLIFSTCTLTKEETVEQSVYIENELKLKKLEEKTFIPGESDCDGFYYAVFIRS
ncbi:MAG: 16S rRNA (cytosine(967)-C(5))-methyltransferase RsmB [Lachnospiraceae bacterium]|nr:16S rRNA (cytosine(967)-C(5))-methyltransferase RsmB [Lachnospiraceae bacterium]